MTNLNANQQETMKGKLKRRVPFKLHRSATKKIIIKQIILTRRRVNTQILMNPRRLDKHKVLNMISLFLLS